MTPSELENNYKRLKDGQLFRLVKEAHTLSPEALLVLKNELLSRGHQEEATKLDNITPYINPYENLSLREIQKIVTQRLESGETIQSIHTDLKEHGVNPIDLFEKDIDRRQKAMSLIEEGMETGNIPDERIKQELQYEEDEIEELKEDVKGKSQWMIPLGVFFLSFAVLALGLYSAGYGRWGTVAGLGAAGLGFLSRGLKIKRIQK